MEALVPHAQPAEAPRRKPRVGAQGIGPERSERLEEHEEKYHSVPEGRRATGS